MSRRTVVVLIIVAVAAVAATWLFMARAPDDGSSARRLDGVDRGQSVTAARDSRRAAVLEAIRERLPANERRVFVLGLDGFDWDYVLPLVEAGRMPNLSRLLAAGTWGTMEPPRPTLSPLIWTSMATGVTPDVHGILDFVEVDPESGREVPVTGRGRRVPALWNIASALGKRVDVVGWWATWPAERVAGTMVSDRLYYTLTQGIEREVLREDPPAMVLPAESTRRFAGIRDRAVRDTDWDVVRRFLDVDEAAFREAVEAGRGMEDPVDGFRRILAATRTYLGAGLELAKGQPDLLMVYLEGTDTIGHLLARYLPPPVAPDTTEAEAAVYAAAVPPYFEAVDRWIGRYLEILPLSEVSWAVISDHGFKWGEDRPRESGHFDAVTAALWHEDDAIFLLAGRGVAALGRTEGRATVYDVTPTLAALLGLPRGEGWRGALLPGVDAPDLEPLDYRRLLPPATYRSEVSAPAPVDQEFLDQLRALGYLGGEEATAAPPAGEDRPADAGTGISPVATRGELNNLGIIHLREGRLEQAERVFREAIRRFPDYAAPYYNLHNVYMKQQRYEEADRYLWEAVARSPVDPVERLEQAANDYDAADELERAVVLLDEAVRRFPDAEELWVHILFDLGRLDRCAEGRAKGRAAVEHLPESPRILTLYGMAAGCAGESAEARRILERSLALDPDQRTARNALSRLP
ncbi:MAG: alkaline phosphatase family protein [Thermoanaerobaculia bacterium]